LTRQRTCNSLRCNELGRGGVIYFNARHYDPKTGRFITEDPSAQGTGWYNYANNNPLTYVDPDGRREVEGESPEEDERKVRERRRKEREDDDDDKPKSFGERILENFRKSQMQQIQRNLRKMGAGPIDASTLNRMSTRSLSGLSSLTYQASSDPRIRLAPLASDLVTRIPFEYDDQWRCTQIAYNTLVDLGLNPGTVDIARPGWMFPEYQEMGITITRNIPPKNTAGYAYITTTSDNPEFPQPRHVEAYTYGSGETYTRYVTPGKTPAEATQIDISKPLPSWIEEIHFVPTDVWR
jgi:hypothetical protein